MHEPVVKVSKWGKVGKVFLILFVILLTLAAAAYTATGIPSGASAYQKNRDAARTAGLFFTEEEITNFNRVPDNQNAAKILAGLPSPDIGYESDKFPKVIQQKWMDISAGLVKLEEASKRQCIVDYDLLDSSFDEEPKTLSNARTWGKILMILAADGSEKGDLVATTKYFRLAAFLSSRLDDDHSYAGFIVRSSLARSIEAAIRKAIPSHASQKAWIAMFTETMRHLDEPYDLSSLLRVEHYHEIANLERMIARRNEDYVTSQFSIGTRLPRFRQASLSRLHEYYAAILPKLPKNPDNLDEAEAAFTAQETIFDKWDWSYSYVQSAGTPGSYIVKLIRMEYSYRNALLQALEILRTDRNPALGLPLRGKYRIDLDKNPIRVKKLPKGWVVYSVGSNETDEGGIEDAKSKPDFVVHLSETTVPPPLPKPKSTPSGSGPRVFPVAPASSANPSFRSD